MGGIVAGIDLSDVVRYYALTATVQLLRASVGAWVDGRWTPGARAPVSLTASVQPFMDDTESLPEGQRSRQMLNVWSTSAMRPVRRKEGTPGDIIVHDGAHYEVEEFLDWARNGNYWQARCVKVEQ